MIKGWKKLTKGQLEHLKEMKCNNTFLFQKTINEQARQKKEFFEKHGVECVEPCLECKWIAGALGMKPKA